MGNPNHDPKTGEFSDGLGGAGTGDKTSDDAIAGKYLPRLEASLGKDAEFRKVYEEVKTNVTREQAVKIASKFVTPMAASTSRVKAIDRIWYRHKSLMAFKNE